LFFDCIFFLIVNIKNNKLILVIKKLEI